jgi:arsenical pump membrane protein
MNNLPAALIAGSAVQVANGPDRLTSAILVGVDLSAEPLRHRLAGDHSVAQWTEAGGLGSWRLELPQIGVLVMPPALVLALGGLFIF